jgi:hypothetical protein
MEVEMREKHSKGTTTLVACFQRNEPSVEKAFRFSSASVDLD